MLIPGNGARFVSASEFNDDTDPLMMDSPIESKDLFDYVQKNERQVPSAPMMTHLFSLRPLVICYRMFLHYCFSELYFIGDIFLLEYKPGVAIGETP